MTKPKLLLADDSVTIRKVVELTFADEGVEVFAVGDGDAAMLKFVEIQPDIVLVDVEMPGPNGYQICEMIKQDEATQHIPVLLLVGSFEPFDQDLAERSGADGFLTKPFHSIRDLVARVSDLLAGDSAADAGPEIEDIEDLYTSSFADTLPIQDYDTEEDPFAGHGVEDGVPEMVPYDAALDKPIEETFADLEPDREMTEPVSSGDVVAERPAVPFSDQVLDDELIEAVSQGPAPDEDHFSNAARDDEMIEAFHPAGAIEVNEAPETALPIDDPASVKDFDWSPAAKITSEPEQKPDTTDFEPRFVFAEAETVEGNYFSGHEGHRAPPAEDPVDGPSEELISLLAKRVVEKLSDRVIREIAQDAVPRIAEKLIREALEEDKNT